jgi:hypothetical protein
MLLCDKIRVAASTPSACPTPSPTSTQTTGSVQVYGAPNAAHLRSQARSIHDAGYSGLARAGITPPTLRRCRRSLGAVTRSHHAACARSRLLLSDADDATFVSERLPCSAELVAMHAGLWELLLDVLRRTCYVCAARGASCDLNEHDLNGMAVRPCKLHRFAPLLLLQTAAATLLLLRLLLLRLLLVVNWWVAVTRGQSRRKDVTAAVPGGSEGSDQAAVGTHGNFHHQPDRRSRCGRGWRQTGRRLQAAPISASCAPRQHALLQEEGKKRKKSLNWCCG